MSLRSGAKLAPPVPKEGWRGWENLTTVLPARAGPLSHGYGLALASDDQRAGIPAPKGGWANSFLKRITRLIVSFRTGQRNSKNNERSNSSRLPPRKSNFLGDEKISDEQGKDALSLFASHAALFLRCVEVAWHRHRFF